MENKYRFAKTSKSYVCYHLVFCTRRRRGILQMDGVEARFKELLLQICAQNNYDILAFECGADYCYLHVSVLPDVSPHEVCKNIKYGTGSALKNPACGTWTAAGHDRGLDWPRSRKPHRLYRRSC